MQEFVGIDVSKEWLDVHCLVSGETLRVKNQAVDIQLLAKRLRRVKRVVLEATGGYEYDLATHLEQHALDVRVVNPKRVRDFARSTGKLAKTDKLDARILAQFCARQPETLDKFPVHPQLKALQGHRQDLVKLITMQKNRSAKAGYNPLKDSVERILTCLKQELQAVEAQIKAYLAKDPLLKAKAQVLEAVKGVGFVLSTTLLSQLSELGYVNGKEIAALVGVAPFNCDSGLFRGKRRIWGGRESVRHNLYLAAFIASRYNPEIKLFYQKLIEKGKPFKVAIIACARKLLVILNAKMRDHLALLHT